tara:strand:+ start:884 stop:1081 length:198 start_codon:yes stop_codon:yes gene_type:complete
MECDSIKVIIDSGLEGCLIVFFCVLSYKIYSMKIKSKSSCCDDHIKLETINKGNFEEGENDNIPV